MYTPKNNAYLDVQILSHTLNKQNYFKKLSPPTLKRYPQILK